MDENEKTDQPQPDQPDSGTDQAAPEPNPSADHSIGNDPAEHIDSTFEEGGAIFGRDPLGEADSGAPATEPVAEGRHFSAPHPGKRTLFVAVGVLILLGMAVVAFWMWQNSPNKIAGAMVKKMEQTKSANYQAEATLDLKGKQESDSATGTLTVKGVYSKEQQDRTAFDVKFVGTAGGQSVDVGAETRVIDKTGFVKPTGNLNFGFFDATALKDQWIRFEAGGDEKEATPTSQELNRSWEILMDSHVVRIGKKLPDEEVDGAKSHHLSFSLDKAELKRVGPEIAKANGLELQTKDVDAYNKWVDELRVDGGALWIDKKTKHLRRVQLTTGVNDQETVATLVTTVTLSNFDNTASIEEPSPAINTDEAMKKLTGPSTGGDQDKDGLADADEAKYGANPANPDTDGDTFKDGDEVQKGFNPAGPGKLPTPSPTPAAT